ncbi:MAG TPA: hypothetical protein ENG95_03695 [Nitrospirae bacterium]|nr:hypothetical protein [Nitrospirota bacterium]
MVRKGMAEIDRNKKIIDHRKRSLKLLRWSIRVMDSKSTLKSDYVFYRDTIRLLDADRKRLQGKIERLALRQACLKEK